MVKKRSEIVCMMSYNNGHNPNLVDKINLIATIPNRLKLLYDILIFLANTYSDELEGIFGYQIVINKSNICNYSYTILTDICDDVDLNTIISYCRTETLIGGDNANGFNNHYDVKDYFNTTLID